MDIHTAAALAEHSAEDARVSEAVSGMDKLLLTLLVPWCVSALTLPLSNSLSLCSVTRRRGILATTSL